MIKQEKKKRLFSFALPSGTDPARLFSSHAQRPYSLFFDSNRECHPLNRYSYLCIDPFETIESRNGNVVITTKSNRYSYAADPFSVVKERLVLAGNDMATNKDLPPFQGGAAGFFGYDLARQLENFSSSTAPDNGIPDMCIGLYDCIAAFNHHAEKGWIIVQAHDEATALERAALFHPSSVEIIPNNPPLQWHTKIDDNEYKNNIQKVIDYIYAGDIFQANLSRRFTADIPETFDSYAHYCRLREINPAPYSTFMRFKDSAFSGSSPERFLSVKAGKVETRPIKGTMPSKVDPSHLLKSEKDRAENAMIVDLMRNDISKVCEDHSVDVPSLFSIETFEGIHHMVSTVTGQLRADKNSLDLLRACFPGGSITGAPKIRAMQIIDELEPDRRGPYCGAMGFIGWNGDMETNIVIRTLVYNRNTVSLQTGGGITAESDPAKELDETLVKAERLFASFDVEYFSDKKEKQS